VNGFPIICGVNGLAEAIATTSAKAVVISSQKVPYERVLQAQQACERTGARLLRMNIGLEPAAPAAGSDAAGTTDFAKAEI
jgi:hypothetical protein